MPSSRSRRTCSPPCSACARKAQESGNLKSNEQQKVIVEAARPAASDARRPSCASSRRIPQVIYVPAYNPTVVYGGWGYPAYPPYYWPPYPAYYPGCRASATGFAWGIGLAAAGAIFGNCNWGGGDVNINVNKAANIDRNFDRNKVQGGGQWQHDAGHRQGVAYRDNATREKFGSERRRRRRARRLPRPTAHGRGAAGDGGGRPVPVRATGGVGGRRCGAGDRGRRRRWRGGGGGGGAAIARGSPAQRRWRRCRRPRQCLPGRGRRRRRRSATSTAGDSSTQASSFNRSGGGGGGRGGGGGGGGGRR